MIGIQLDPHFQIHYGFLIGVPMYQFLNFVVHHLENLFYPAHMYRRTVYLNYQELFSLSIKSS
jgi:hypothetical protein